jgi:hypothetical protein
MSLVSRGNKYTRLMKKIKTFETFFGGTHLGSDQVNVDSSVIRNNTSTPDHFSLETEDTIIKSQIIDFINDCNLEDLKKIKNYLNTL